MFETLTTVATYAGTFASAATSALSSGGEGVGGSVHKSESKKYYDPLLTLFVLARIDLLTADEKYKIKLNFGDVVSLSFNSASEQLRRTVSRVTGDHQKRKQAKYLVDVALRAMRWYDPNEETEQGAAMRYLFEKSIEGLKVYRNTYASDRDDNTEKALSYIDRSIMILQLKLHEGREEDIYGDKAKRYLQQIKEKIERQIAEEGQNKQNVERISRDLWMTDEKGSVDSVDLVTYRIEELKTLSKLKQKMDDERTKTADETFCFAKKELLEALTIKEENFKHKLLMPNHF